MTKLNHFNDAGDAHMVDVGDKPVTLRKAVAQGRIQMQAETCNASSRVIIKKAM